MTAIVGLEAAPVLTTRSATLLAQACTDRTWSSVGGDVDSNTLLRLGLLEPGSAGSLVVTKAGQAAYQSMLRPHSPIRWVGCKRKVAGTIWRIVETLFGSATERFYCEPCAGGANVFFEGRDVIAILADQAPIVTGLYTGLRNDVDGVLRELCKAQKRIENSGHGAELVFEHAKAKYNGMLTGRSHVGEAEYAAMAIILNRMAHKGLWRVNQSGGFNVDFDHTYSKDIVRAPLLHGVSRRLQAVQVYNLDFASTIAACSRGVLYIDPPYWPRVVPGAPREFFGPALKPVHSQYTAKGFDAADHVRLLRSAVDAVERGCAVIVSGPWEPGWVSRYQAQGFIALPLTTHRTVSAKVETRGPEAEVLLIGSRDSALLAHVQAMHAPTHRGTQCAVELSL